MTDVAKFVAQQPQIVFAAALDKNCVAKRQASGIGAKQSNLRCCGTQNLVVGKRHRVDDIDANSCWKLNLHELRKLNQTSH